VTVTQDVMITCGVLWSVLLLAHIVLLLSLLCCVTCSIIGMLLGACIAFYIIIGDLSPAIISKLTGLEVCFGVGRMHSLLLLTCV